jgi:dephospho-CoA kinase
MSCLLIAGAIASGKTTTARLLADQTGARLIQIRDALSQVLALPNADRRQLQEGGRELDRRTAGRWLVEYLSEVGDVGDDLVVDSVRTERQTVPVLRELAETKLIYLEASASTRRARFERAAATDELKRSRVFDQAMRYVTETEVTKLRSMADVTIETDDLRPQLIVQEIRSALNV